MALVEMYGICSYCKVAILFGIDLLPKNLIIGVRPSRKARVAHILLCYAEKSEGFADTDVLLLVPCEVL